MVVIEERRLKKRSWLIHWVRELRQHSRWNSDNFMTEAQGTSVGEVRRVCDTYNCSCCAWFFCSVSQCILFEWEIAFSFLLPSLASIGLILQHTLVCSVGSDSQAS